MGLLKLFKLEKLKMEVYPKSDRSGRPEDVLEVMFNPESYSLSYENVFSKVQPPNSSGNAARYQMSKPAKLSLKIIVDGTGVSDHGIIALAKPKKVKDGVKQFLEAAFYMDGSIHEPKFLKIRWGSQLNFDCRLDSVTINYTLFETGGDPLRAELDVTFVDDVETKKRVKKEKKSSPDLTHKRVVKEHDTLPLLCEAIYGTPDYYLQVARANKLINFRNLKPGQELFFPPVKT